MDNTTTERRKRTQRDYTMGFKLAIVEQVEKGQMTYKQAQRHVPGLQSGLFYSQRNAFIGLADAALTDKTLTVNNAITKAVIAASRK